jgi:hypothetical protein
MEELDIQKRDWQNEIYKQCDKDDKELLNNKNGMTHQSSLHQLECRVRQCDIQLVDTWNELHGEDETVTVKKDNGDIVKTKTRSNAFLASDGTPVIFLEGISGYYLLDRVAST